MKRTGRHIRIWQFTATIFLLLNGCGSRTARITEEAPIQTYKVEATAILRIRNPNGSVMIHGSDRKDLELQTRKEGGNKSQLSDMSINVSEQKGSLSITTNVVREKNKALSLATGKVHYTLVVPRTMKIGRIDVDDGDVSIDGMQGEYVRVNVVDGKVAIQASCGDIQVGIANGALELGYSECKQPLVADAQITAGTARISIPTETSLKIRAETLVGQIINQLGDNVEVNGSASRKVNLSLGSGARSEVKVRVTTGDITIARESGKAQASSVH